MALGWGGGYVNEGLLGSEFGCFIECTLGVFVTP